MKRGTNGMCRSQPKYQEPTPERHEVIQLHAGYTIRNSKDRNTELTAARSLIAAVAALR